MIPSSPPKRIGPYRVLKVLGEGSLGQVYLAEQEEPVFRQVAVKVLKPGLDSEEVLTRFEAERKAMALMSHSGIVRVLDAGTTERGLSYLVMEYVDGLPIIEYCDTHKLSVNERLTLFCEICRAVHHAHQRGIIHRDLKPSNILVTEEDGQPLPKVIDFGIAKAIEQPLTDSAPMTIQGSFLGTPEYMSPEQAAGELDIDITTDVYALGVTLYELLTGVLPFGLRLAGLENLLRKLRIQEPPSLADRFDRQGAAREEIATERGTDTRSLRRRLKGELDWIVLKALRKERGHRYQSASELAGDISRYLAAEPVTAGPPSLHYRAGKVIARHKVAFAFATTVVLLLLGFTITLAIQLQRVASEAQRATHEAEVSNAVSGFLEDLFEVSNPSEARGNTITARELLDRGAEKIAGDLEDQPLVQARLMHTMGSVYEGLGLYEPAAALLGQAVTIQQDTPGGDQLRLARSLDALGVLCWRQARYDEAEPLLQRALAIREEELGPEHDTVGNNLNNLAIVYRAMGRYSEAEQSYRRALLVFEKVLGPDDVNLASIRNNLGSLYRRLGRYDEAESMIRQALSAREKDLGPEHLQTASSLNNLANLYDELGRPAEAEPLFIRAAAIWEKQLGPDHPYVATGCFNLGLLNARLRRWAESETYYLRAREIRKKQLGDDHPDYALVLHALANVYRDQGRHSEAEPLYTRSLAITEAALGPGHLSVASILNDLARLRRLQGDAETAENLLLRALAIQENAGLDQPELAETLHNYAELMREQGRVDEAAELEERAGSIRSRPESP